ncbi:MAG: Ada metal-binding domain-containing protein [Marinobacter sp.]
MSLTMHYSGQAAECGVIDKGASVRTYKLLAADGTIVISKTPGTLGGNSKAKIYGRLDCTAANGALSKGYAEHRVFFADEQNAIHTGYRPCGRCMTSQYKDWNSGPEGKESYPWKQLPK